MTPLDYAYAAVSAIAMCLVLWAFLSIGMQGDLIIQEILR